jgi:HEAT repeat protein
MYMPGGNIMNENELYKELGVLTKDKSRWEESIPYVASLLDHASEKIRAKALWLLGEMGLEHPQGVKNAVPAIASFCDSSSPLLRERAVNALGRIGRGDYRFIESYWPDMFRFADDAEPKVRLSFIWASENIATNTPDIYEGHMEIFAKLLSDEVDQVRMEAPEIFRVLGKRRPQFVRPYIETLRKNSETDPNRVVRIHSAGAIKATGLA